MNYFITETYLETYTPITANIDVTDVTPWVKTAAEMWIQPILGTYFYEDLLTKYNAQTLSGSEITIVGMIQPAIAWRAASDAVYGLSRQLKNKGLQRQDGEFSSSVELSEVEFAMAHYRQKGEFYENQISKYLCANKDLFSAFTSTLNTDSLIKPQCGCSNNYTQTIIII